MAPNLSTEYVEYVTMELEDTYDPSPSEGPVQEEFDNVHRVIPLLDRLRSEQIRFNNMLFEERRQLIEDLRAEEFTIAQVEEILNIMRGGSILGSLLLQEFSAQIEVILHEANERALATVATNLDTLDEAPESSTTMEN